MTRNLARRIVVAASALGFLLGGVTPCAVFADGTAVTIHFQRGATCWRYAGAATTFNGSFRAGQRLAITSTGEAAEAGGIVKTVSRFIYVADSRTGRLLTADSGGQYAIPATGLYQITFGPMSVVGAPGTMIVCTV
jgi:hypothetical protein